MRGRAAYFSDEAIDLAFYSFAETINAYPA